VGADRSVLAATSVSRSAKHNACGLPGHWPPQGMAPGASSTDATSVRGDGRANDYVNRLSAYVNRLSGCCKPAIEMLDRQSRCIEEQFSSEWLEHQEGPIETAVRCRDQVVYCLQCGFSEVKSLVVEQK